MSKEIFSERELNEKLTRLINQLLPEVLRQNVNNLLEGVLITANVTTRTASVKILGTSSVINDLKIYKGVGDFFVGDRCVLASIDPKNKTKLYIIAVY